MEHKSIPWEVHFSIHGHSASIRGAHGEEIAMNIYGPYAEMIVLAVNAHNELLEALKFILDRLNDPALVAIGDAAIAKAEKNS